MSYMALYRKWRPNEFESVKGQDHIVKTLRNQIISNRIGHAYLFCGTRGTGKTSVAKLFAKAVNCENSINGSPCNECNSCKAINSQISMNVIEIDAASNSGVDNIRDIKDEVKYSPTDGKYKVYIIDEVHMLSIGAFNALLKTLEEPPSYVIFILATTETHKIPITITSRCQKYDFKRISIDTISNRLIELMNYENIEVEKKAIYYIAKLADGSMRDALSLLDQCVSLYIGKTLKYENVLDILGTVDTEVFAGFLNCILKQNIIKSLEMLDKIIMDGRELSQFVNDFVWYLRNVLLIKGSDKVEDILDMSAENIEVLKEQSLKITENKLMRYIRIFSDLSAQIKNSMQKRVLIEIAIIKLCKPEVENDLSSLIERVSNLEKQLLNGVIIKQENEVLNQPNINFKDDKIDVIDEVKKIVPPKDLEELKRVASKWNDVISTIDRGGLKRALNSGKPTISNNPNILNIIFYDEMCKQLVERDENLKMLEDIFSEKTGKKISIHCEFLNNQNDNSPQEVDLRNLDSIKSKLNCADDLIEYV